MSRWDVTSCLYALRRFSLWRGILQGELSACERLLLSVQTDGLILDVGTGRGTAAGLPEPDAVIVGLDGSKQMLMQARQRDIECIQGDGLALPVKKGVFDGVTAIGLSEYIKDETALFDEVARVLKPGGWFRYTISPPSVWTFLRRFLGHRLKARRLDPSAAAAAECGFSLAASAKTMMQAQMRFVKDQ